MPADIDHYLSMLLDHLRHWLTRPLEGATWWRSVRATHAFFSSGFRLLGSNWARSRAENVSILRHLFTKCEYQRMDNTGTTLDPDDRYGSVRLVGYYEAFSGFCFECGVQWDIDLILLSHHRLVSYNATVCCVGTWRTLLVLEVLLNGNRLTLATWRDVASKHELIES